MKYLQLHTETGEVFQTNTEPSQEDLESVDIGERDIFTVDGTRGFCRILVGSNEDDNGDVTWEIADLERVVPK